MKKTFCTLAILASLATTNAYAKTEGHYATLNIIETELKAGNLAYSRNGETADLANTTGYKIRDEKQISFGLNYKYAFNFDGLYVAPGVFYDHSDIQTVDAENDLWELNHRYGLRLDIGYDITDKFSAYLFGALAVNEYGIDTTNGSNIGSTTDTDLDTSGAYGLGVKYSVANNIDINLEYEQLGSYEAEIIYANTGNRDVQDFEVNVARIGIAYKF